MISKRLFKPRERVAVDFLDEFRYGVYPGVCSGSLEMR